MSTTVAETYRSAQDNKVNSNFEIRAKVVRVIGSDGSQVGVLPLDEAIKLAKDEGLDLVEISGKSDPKVCKIISLSKYKYQQDIKRKDIKKNTVRSEVKEIKLRPVIEDHDLNVKIKQLEKFISQNDKVKVTVQLNGREIGRPEQAVRIINKIAEALKDKVVIDSGPSINGKFVIALFSKRK